MLTINPCYITSGGNTETSIIVTTHIWERQESIKTVRQKMNNPIIQRNGIKMNVSSSHFLIMYVQIYINMYANKIKWRSYYILFILPLVYGILFMNIKYFLKYDISIPTEKSIM